ncbi:MAG TPA: hypothetical protein VF469_15715 [Kofleriaceae bacterium]
MKIVTWRNTALALAVICGCQRWQSCTHAAAPAEPATPEVRRVAEITTTAPPVLPDAPSPGEPVAGPGKSFYGFKVPAWAMRLAPQRGETMRAYRDRILPLAEIAVAPQRARVARTLADFANLDPHQRAELDAAVAAAAKAIQDRVTTAFASGELRPATFKPMTGIAIARDVLDIVDRGNTRFLSSLAPDQRTQLASHRFDFADYLVFSAHWEDALHALD